jgi:hypothetical protein
MKREKNSRETQGPMPKGYDGTTTRKQQGRSGLLAAGGVYIILLLNLN